MTLTAFPVSAGSDELTLSAARPEGAGPFPAIVLLPAIAGVNDYIDRTAERLCRAGYMAVIQDYYARDAGPPDVSSPQKIGEAVAGLSDPRVLADIGSTLTALKDRDDVIGDAVGLLGFCIGGVYAFLSACEHQGIAAAVDYYGMIAYGDITENKPVSPIDRVPELGAPLLAHFGDFDRLISQPDVEAFGAALRANQKNHEINVYGGAPHAFDEDFRDVAFRPVASGEAWQRTMTFLDWHLRRISPR